VFQLMAARVLCRTLLCLYLLTLAAAQQTWESAPQCPDNGGATAVDSLGRSWGWFNNQSCKRSNGAVTEAQQRATWDSAPACSSAPTGDNSKPDSQGRLWGWQDGRSCKHTGSVTVGSSPAPTVTWESAPPCSETPTTRNSRADRLGRYWGWQNGASCRYNSAPQAPAPSPTLTLPRKPPTPLPKRPVAAVPKPPPAEDAGETRRQGVTCGNVCHTAQPWIGFRWWCSVLGVGVC
jgi:hypothetical protein